MATEHNTKNLENLKNDFGKFIDEEEKEKMASSDSGHDQKEVESFHRSLHHLNKGGLHRALGVKEGEPIPASKLSSALKSKNPHMRKMAQFAQNTKSWGK